MAKFLGVEIKRVNKQTEQRSSLSNPSQWLIDALSGMFGGQNDSGQQVTATTALQIAAVKDCVAKIADGISNMTLKLYKETPDGSRTAVFDNNAIRVLNEPNSFQNKSEFLNWIGLCLSYKGNAYVYKVTDGLGNTIALMPLNPDSMSVNFVNNEVVYKYGGTGYASDNILHFRVFCSDLPYLGKSPIQEFAQSLGITLAAKSSQAKIYKTGSLKFLLKTLSKVDDNTANTLRESMENVINGKQLSAMLPQGTDIDKISMSPQEAQFIETMKYSDSDIAKMFGVPAALIGAETSSSDIEELLQHFYATTLSKYAIVIQEELERKLLKESEKPTHYFKFNFNSLLRAKSSARMEYYMKAIQIGIMSPNEIRRYEDMEDRENGDEYYIMANLMPSSKFNEYVDARILQLTARSQSGDGSTNNPTGNNQEFN
jgi:HK97 family phage portal protein